MNLTDDYVELHKDALQSSAVALHSYRLANGRGQVHVFVEGDEDISFYAPRIRSHIADERELAMYPCGGKSDVLKCQKEYAKDKKEDDLHLFLVDKDYDDIYYNGKRPTLPSEVYETQFYSIENYVCGETGLSIVANDVIGAHKLTSIDGLLRVYRNVETQFVRFMKPFTAVILAAREAGEKPNLNNLNLKKFLTVDLNNGLGRKAKPLTNFAKVCGVKLSSFPLSSVKKWMKKLNGTAFRIWLRGKFDLWLLETFVETLIKSGHEGATPLAKRKLKKHNHLARGTLLPTLSTRVPVCPGLTNYLNEHLA